MRRDAPSWFVKWLRDWDRGLTVAWNQARECWEILRRQPTGEMRYELTWPHWQIASPLCDLVQKGAWYRRNQEFRYFWREQVKDPAARQVEQRRQAVANVEADIAKASVAARRRALGETMQVGAVTNERTNK
jgi:hypothetical protein